SAFPPCRRRARLFAPPPEGSPAQWFRCPWPPEAHYRFPWNRGWARTRCSSKTSYKNNRGAQDLVGRREGRHLRRSWNSSITFHSFFLVRIVGKIHDNSYFAGTRGSSETKHTFSAMTEALSNHGGTQC